MSKKSIVTGRVDPELEEALERYADTADVSRSEAIRQLLERGLATVDVETGEIAVEDKINEWWARRRRRSSRLFANSAKVMVLFFLAFIVQSVAVETPDIVRQVIALGVGVAFTTAVIGAVAWGVISVALRADRVRNWLFELSKDMEWFVPEEDIDPSAIEFAKR